MVTDHDTCPKKIPVQFKISIKHSVKNSHCHGKVPKNLCLKLCGSLRAIGTRKILFTSCFRCIYQRSEKRDVTTPRRQKNIQLDQIIQLVHFDLGGGSGSAGNQGLINKEKSRPEMKNTQEP